MITTVMQSAIRGTVTVESDADSIKMHRTNAYFAPDAHMRFAPHEVEALIEQLQLAVENQRNLNASRFNQLVEGLS